MEDELNPSYQYIKGSNAGYQMQQHEPKLMGSILKSENLNNEFNNAMTAGAKQQRKEILFKEQKAIEEHNKTKQRHK